MDWFKRGFLGSKILYGDPYNLHLFLPTLMPPPAPPASHRLAQVGKGEPI